MHKAVFLDRDGTVIEECNYLKDPEQVKLFPGAAQAVKLLKEKGFLTVIVTNQSGIARGYFDIHTLQQVHAKMNLLLAVDGVAVDSIYYCPHYPGGIIAPFNIDCDCRKPQIGLALQAQKEFDIDLNHSYMIGDKEVDVDFGKNFGAKAAILVATGYGKNNPHTNADYRAKDLLDAATWILKNEL
ncbi:MAG TPA: D,D-heptose 1,7-bisphosphate phosphatase [Firmicutes bacterium]|jgi:D-glycero-D-manno-heptose 1,7-bisphosphate phosphatase|nr:D,D-heptose 1,7-bisphosphate phosphatase [Bacillota bacterium]